jgi:hypothetical protein
MNNTLKEKINKNIIVVGECWVWLGSLDQNGRPRVVIDARSSGESHSITHIVHKVLYQEKFGEVSARYIDNTCGNLRCVNPEHHTPRTLEARLSNYLVDEETGCWLWQGDFFADTGYGRMTVDGKTSLVHRVAYAHYNGVEIPKGLMVCHTCNNRRCMNPDHLYLGTHNDNMRDKAQSNVMKGEDNPKALLTKEQVIEIKQHIRERRIVYREIGRMYGVSRQAIKDIASGRTWGWLE